MSAPSRLPRRLRAIPVVGPVVGRIAREIAEGDRDTKWYLAPIVVTPWALAIAAWGLPAVVAPFALAVPFCLAMLVALTRG